MMMNSEFENYGEDIEKLIHLEPLTNVSGGTCNVYSTRLSGKKVFVKKIKPEFSDDPRMIAAFRKEAEIGFRLEHPGLPKYIFAEGILPMGRYIVQEFIDGQSLPEFVKENPVYFKKEANVEKFIRELADVVDYLHGNQIVHLDIKPENIVISRVGHSLKLTDFGFCSTDFYDETRGFTARDIAPEGSENPAHRGTPSDFYGLGKVLEFIRNNTPEFPKRKFKRLENGLLLTDPDKRIASKEEIEKHLGSKHNNLWLWPASFIAMAFVVAAILFLTGVFSKKEERSSPVISFSDEPDKEETLSIKEDAENESNVVIQPKITIIEKENVEEKAVQSPPDDSPPVRYPMESLDKIKEKMAVNIRRNFAGFNKLLVNYIREEKYSERDKKEINDFYVSSLQKSFDTREYKARYKEISPDLIDDTLTEVYEEEESKDWGSAFREYMKEYERRSQGSSR